jgi:hypothetical protein
MVAAWLEGSCNMVSWWQMIDRRQVKWFMNGREMVRQKVGLWLEDIWQMVGRWLVGGWQMAGKWLADG